MKKVRVVFAGQHEEISLPSGGQNEKWHENKLSFEYVGPIGVLIDWLSNHELHDAVMEEPDLESIFMNYYER